MTEKILHTDMCCIALLHVFCLVRQVKLLPDDLISIFCTVAIQMLRNLTDSIMAFFFFPLPNKTEKWCFRYRFIGGLDIPPSGTGIYIRGKAGKEAVT